MTPRIDPCEVSTYHRWELRAHYYSTPEHPVTALWCVRCGKWYVDVVIRPKAVAYTNVTDDDWVMADE